MHVWLKLMREIQTDSHTAESGDGWYQKKKTLLRAGVEKQQVNMLYQSDIKLRHQRVLTWTSLIFCWSSVYTTLFTGYFSIMQRPPFAFKCGLLFYSCWRARGLIGESWFKFRTTDYMVKGALWRETRWSRTCCRYSSKSGSFRGFC